jgi:hypothetical protein
MGETDGSWRYSGWNLDEIEIRALRTDATAAPGTPAVATRLEGAAPNPFNPRTDVRFTLARAGHVRLTVHDARGRLVAELQDATMPAGNHAIAWDGTDRTGRRLGSGLYFARLVSDGEVDTSKLVLVK